MRGFKKLAVVFLSLTIILAALSPTVWAATANPDVTPAQIAASMSEDPQHSVNITWTTIETSLVDAKVSVYAGNQLVTTVSATKTIRSVSNSNLIDKAGNTVTQKAFYSVAVTGLEANTEYTYVCSAIDATGNVFASTGNSFKTAPSTTDEFSFIYLSDTQSSGVNGKAITANTSIFANLDPSFIYIAGDLTDTSTNEGQWEMFFNQKASDYINPALVNKNYESAMSDFVISAVQGNHDNNTFANHLSYPASGGTNITYAYTYGCVRFIMLNFENVASRPEQQEFLREQVAFAKTNGLWSVVGFHKSIYSGASHMNDSDVRDARLYWSPIFAELDVDVVLQGHDHVLSRGFVDANGDNAGNTTKNGNRSYIAEKPTNAPLYYVANCASTLKFYALIASYSGLAAPDYGFLDLNSARPAGHAQNPDGPQTSDSLAHPTFVNVTATASTLVFDTYMFSYDRDNDVAGEPYLFDSLTVTRNTGQTVPADLRLVSDKSIVRPNDYFNVSASLQTQTESNLIKIELTFDAEKLDFAGYTPAAGATTLTSDIGTGFATILVMQPNYQMDSLGSFMLQAKSTVGVGSTEITAIATFVEKVDSNKSVQITCGSLNQKTSNIGTGGFEVDMILLSNLIDAFGMTSADPGWDEFCFFDFNGNNEIDIFDIVTVAKMVK
jgi:predicted phosphodiesterase